MVTWNKIRPRTVVGGDILGYRVLYTTQEDATRWSRVISGEENTKAELKDLKIYTMYCVRVMGYNRRGDGIASLPVCAYTDKDGKILLRKCESYRPWSGEINGYAALKWS